MNRVAPWLLSMVACTSTAGCLLLVGGDLDGLSAGSDSPNVGDVGPDRNADRDGDRDRDGDGDGDGDAQTQRKPLMRPAEGVYTYAASGADTMSFGNATGKYGPTATFAIVHGPDECFTGTLRLRASYEDAMDFCIRGGALVRTGGHRLQVFQVLGGVSVQTFFKCAPGDVFNVDAPGAAQSWPHDCTGSNSESQNGKSSYLSKGPYTFLGEESVPVGVLSIPARHFKEELSVTQSQQGTNTVDWYFATELGVPVRIVRKTDIDFRSVITVKYTENADLTLTSTTPLPLQDAGSN